MHKPNRKPSPFFDLLRVFLIPLSLIVAAGLLLILLPQSTMDRIVQDLELRREVSAHEKIAFLYLGHQVRNNRFHIRGVIRNISSDPIEQLDAAVRLYASGNELLETAIVRMDRETIGPDEMARFELVYPDSGAEFSSYSVEFKLRKGDVIPYKDMRKLQAQSDRKPSGVKQ